MTDTAELSKLYAERDKRLRECKIEFFKPYVKQLEFFELGAKYRTRLFSAAPQLGKTEAGAYEAACHMTGIYPPWWKGRVFDKATKGWIGGVTGQNVRDTCQAKLFGPPGVPELFGSGLIPKANTDPKRCSLAHGYAGLFDTAYVRHVSGNWSSVGFKTYEQGREKWQSATLDWIWMDEESNIDIHTEALARTRATDGILWTTYTPMKGNTALTQYLRKPSDYNAVVTMSIYDCPHLNPPRIKEIEETTPEWEKDARIWGRPGAGTGLVFEVEDAQIIEDALPRVPLHWKKIWGIDFGGSAASKEGSHPFAAALLAWDVDADVIHVIHALKMRRSEPMQHAKAMMPFGRDVPVAWPHDGNRGVPGYGGPMAKLYKDEGLRMLPTHAAWPDSSIAVEPGITEMDQRMKTGKLKVARHLTEWLEEKRGYHREDMKIVPIDDDLMSATRIAIMAKRFARTVEHGPLGTHRNETRIAKDVDYDPFAWAA